MYSSSRINNSRSRMTISNKGRGGKHKTYVNEDTEEDNEDYSEVTVVDNNIYFFTDVNCNSILELTLAIKEVTQKMQIHQIKFNVEPPPITLYINSDGGEVHSALSVFDTITDNPVEIITVISGNACSAATIISLAGHTRYITPNSYMLIHNISSAFWGKMHEFEDEMKNLAKLTSNLKRIYKSSTKLTKPQLDNLLKKDLLLDAKTCVKYGMVDAIDS